MEISVADERAWLLREQLSMDQAEGRAWTRKTEAFGALAKMTGFLQRPKDEDFELVYKEHRYQPFWQVVCSARYVYERSRRYPLALSGPEVEAVTIAGTRYEAINGLVNLTGLEHCREESRQEVFVEGITGEKVSALADYLKFTSAEVLAEDLDDFAPEGTIVVPPRARASALVREVLAGMIKSVQADRILEEQVAVEQVNLYYRPVYAFQYRWLSKEKEAIMEYDALTGDLQAGGKTFQQYVGKVLDPEFLFDVGIDTIDLLVPGGGIAIKLARKGIGVARDRSKKE